MQLRRTKGLFAAGAAVSVTAGMLVFPAVAATAKPVSNITYKPGPDTSMIVMFRTPSHGLASSGRERSLEVAREEAPFLAQLRSAGARGVTSLSIINGLVGTMSPKEAAILAHSPLVSSVIPNGEISLSEPESAGSAASQLAGLTGAGGKVAAGVCGTAKNPQLNPQALSLINDINPTSLGANGAGVKVAFIADAADPANVDFKRNAAYASPGSKAGAPVVSLENFTGDTSSTESGAGGGEAFLDASSIGAQGNSEYDLSQFVSSAHPLPKGCDIKIVGAAPGATVTDLDVFSATHDTTESNFVQAIQYAVANGDQVINESFGSNNFPDTTQDVTRDANDAAVAAGVTVVASTGDAGASGTFGSPATDPNVISAGASTSFRAFEQTKFGGASWKGANGQYLNDNASSFSSGGYAEGGNTVDLLAPGDWNWALCEANLTEYPDCSSFAGTASPIEFTGGTSEAAPLIAGAAADVIDAYMTTHHGTHPTPGLVKQILMSTATDVNAPAYEQGAGLLNVGAAIELAKSMPGTSSAGTGGSRISPNQIDLLQKSGATTGKKVYVTNDSANSETVNLSTRVLDKPVGGVSGGSFCLQPGAATSTCPANTGTMKIWSGATEVYQVETFSVPKTTGVSRLTFTATYPDVGQSSLVHIALFQPNGTQAGYTDPQGLGDFADSEVSNPVAGTWSAVFFTVKNGPEGIGSSGQIGWSASTMEYGAGSKITPSTLTIAPGKTGTASVAIVAPKAAGDTSESIVVSNPSTTGGWQTTIPVVQRTLTVPGTLFSGTLTGGNGRADAPAQTNTFSFYSSAGAKNLNVQFLLEVPQGGTTDASVIAELVDPSGQVESYSSNVTTDNFGETFLTNSVSMYVQKPAAGLWSIMLDWVQPVSGAVLSQPFEGEVSYGGLSVSSNLPQGATLTKGKAATYHVTITNNGIAPEEFYIDPRESTEATYALPDQNPCIDTAKFQLPLPVETACGPSYAYYFVPPETSQLAASTSSTVPVSFDSEFFPGDPDISPGVACPGVKTISTGKTASLTFTEPNISSGLWDLNPSEVGPYPSSGAPTVNASASFKATTLAFNKDITAATVQGQSIGDVWEYYDEVNPTPPGGAYVPAGDSVILTITITPSAAISGSLLIEDYTLGSGSGIAYPDTDTVAELPYSYKI